MRYKIKQFVAESKIISFFAGFNRNLLSYFYNSRTHKIFINLCNLFKNHILKNVNESLIVRSGERLVDYLTLKDVGLFIVLVVMFNTLAMMFLKKEIDIFSISARIFFFCLGIFLIFKKKQ